MADSTFTWLDYAERDRRKAEEVLDLFREQGTVDELGLGTIRDALADLLFPGTSTIQTRAKYFLMVPWIYLGLERRGVASAEVAGAARRDEIALIDVLAESEDRAGVIGIQARAGLKRLPSSTYWQGLGAWGIRRFPGSQDQYHRSLDRFYRATAETLSRREGELVEGLPRNWHPAIPRPAEDFPKSASPALTRSEAEFLRERILDRVGDTLLGFLVDQERPADEVAFPWQHPLFGEFPPRVREQLEHGRCFSEALHGAALLYNLILAELRGLDELVGEYRENLGAWTEEVEARRGALEAWDRRRFWELIRSGRGRVGEGTRAFVEGWLDLVLLPGGVRGVSTSTSARALVTQRERTLKRQLARIDNQRARDLWQGASGTARLDYRWGIASRLLSDIEAGLTRPA